MLKGVKILISYSYYNTKRNPLKFHYNSYTVLCECVRVICCRQYKIYSVIHIFTKKSYSFIFETLFYAPWVQFVVGFWSLFVRVLSFFYDQIPVDFLIWNRYVNDFHYIYV